MKTETAVAPITKSFEKIPTVMYESAEIACKNAAAEIAALIRQKKRRGEPTVLGLATGSTPLQVYAELIRLHKEEQLSFKNVVVFNLDEYYPLPADSVESYRHFMKVNLFDHIDINPHNCYIPASNMPEDRVDIHCENYDAQIGMYGGIDLQLLGIGQNGHIGFNEPGAHMNSLTRVIKLEQSTRMNNACHFESLSKVPRYAITMGIGSILRAKKILLLAFGEKKAAIIRNVIEGPVTEMVPASYLQCHQNTLCILDRAAATDLTVQKTPWLIGEVTWDKSMTKKAVIHLALTTGKTLLKLTDDDYNRHGLTDLLLLYGNAYDINIAVFNWLQNTITGWPGGKPGADDTSRPERAEPDKKKVLIFSPHPDDDIISMGGTFQRLVDQGHEVHVAYQTSGNIAVTDDEALRYIAFVNDYNHLLPGNPGNGTVSLRNVKGLIRKSEAMATCKFVGVPTERVHFLNLPFYETGTIEKKPLGTEDIAIVSALIKKVQPHQVYAAGDLADPHGTHKVCLDAILKSLKELGKELGNRHFMRQCWLWLYKGAWAEWDIDAIDMAVPMSPDQVLKKRYGIFKHQSQKDGVMFMGSDNREFWQRAEDRNRATAELYNRLGLPEYEAIEAFVRWKL